MSGPQVAAAITAKRPGLPVLYISGYPGQTLLTRGLLEPGAVLIQKPFAPGTLSRTVREAIERAAPAGILARPVSAQARHYSPAA
jgi:FixJ family two-component response regulator